MWSNGPDSASNSYHSLFCRAKQRHTNIKTKILCDVKKTPIWYLYQYLLLSLGQRDFQCIVVDIISSVAFEDWDSCNTCLVNCFLHKVRRA